MRDVLNNAPEQLFQSAPATLRVHARALQRGLGKCAKNARELAARALDNDQLFFYLELVVLEGGQEAVLVGTDQRWVVLGNDAFHAVGVNRLKVG